ncbi:hypothetical protein SHKM778_57070 [Streptomyces sp. KM77-8]|uniref:Carrier domain-containing protein n=1 Tax=Streptomyces haneummycinicus TaxID=3074435 RepID=A0AAT9HP57_9ACTN
MDWPVFLAWYPQPPPLVADLSAAVAEADPPAAGDGSALETFRAAFRATDPAAREALLTDRFTQVVAGVLRMPPEQVDPVTGLGALGLDSLLAMELRSRVQADLGVTLPVVALLGNTPSVT